jgi:hypothetical protein
MIFFPLLLLLLVQSACSGLFPAPIPSSTPLSSTDTPTFTIVWFPPTHTTTPFITVPVLPTADQQPGIGDLLFSDTFDQPEMWNTSSGSQTSSSINRNRLILSIAGQGPVSISSLRNQPVLEDFFAEATIRLSLCSGKDQFGMIFRSTPGSNYYRYTVSCEGRSRLERILSGSNSPLIDWLSSGDAPTAAPAELQLGVWVVGNEIRVFLNHHLQFSVHDPVLHVGTLGFFVYADGTSPITTAFSDLSVYSVSYVSPTPSLTPTRTRTP